MKRNLLNIALKIALEKLDKHPEYDCYPHYSFIIQNNKILGYGCNMKGEPPVHYGYHNRINGCLPKLHAEFVAYRKMVGLLNNKEFDVVNIRLNGKGEVKNSGPCSCCLGFLKEVGCKNIYYSTEMGWSKLI